MIEAVKIESERIEWELKAFNNISSVLGSDEHLLDDSVSNDEKQAYITQITVGVEQISGVVQNNSATAEESAAASEELSGQANMLKELISTFTVNN